MKAIVKKNIFHKYTTKRDGYLHLHFLKQNLKTEKYKNKTGI